MLAVVVFYGELHGLDAPEVVVVDLMMTAGHGSGLGAEEKPELADQRADEVHVLDVRLGAQAAEQLPVLRVHGGVKEQGVLSRGPLHDALDLLLAADPGKDVHPRHVAVELGEDRAGDLLGRVPRRVREDHDLLLHD